MKGANLVFKGTLLPFLADNLASNELGGSFKLSFLLSFHCCQTCLLTNDEMSKEFSSDNWCLRDLSRHKSQCEEVKGPTTAHYSKTYGIKSMVSFVARCAFSFFWWWFTTWLYAWHFWRSQALLKHCITAQYFTLEEYNKSIVHFNYGYTESDRPMPIVQRHLQSGDRSIEPQMLLCYAFCHSYM